MSGEIFRVGQEVDFKVDIEGHGTVIHVQTRRDFMGYTRRTYFIAQEFQPNGYQFHPAAHFVSSHGINRMCVVIDDGYKMWAVD